MIPQKFILVRLNTSFTIINNDGDIFEKDLGDRTARIASRIATFNPDHTWRKVVDTEK